MKTAAAFLAGMLVGLALTWARPPPSPDPLKLARDQFLIRCAIESRHRTLKDCEEDTQARFDYGLR